MSLLVLGIMSGSSLDGLDLALCRISDEHGPARWDIPDARCIPYPEEWQRRLSEAPALSGLDLTLADADFGRWVGHAARDLISQYPDPVDLIASHGHTIFHDPGAGISLQIGHGAHIAAVTGVDTITSFRCADVALGGQGAPFAPAVDRALFPGYDGYLNLGGIANVYIPGAAGTGRAWDIGPCNQVLNYLARRLGYPYDRDGAIARTGTLRAEVTDALISMFPPANGQPRGMSNQEVQASWIAHLESSPYAVPDLLTCATDAVARLITSHICEVMPSAGTILVTGGGAHNSFLVERLRAYGGPIGATYAIPDSTIIDFKECLLMAWLGYLARHRRPFGLAPLTGATRDSIGGAYYIGHHAS